MAKCITMFAVGSTDAERCSDPIPLNEALGQLVHRIEEVQATTTRLATRLSAANFYHVPPDSGDNKTVELRRGERRLSQLRGDVLAAAACSSSPSETTLADSGGSALKRR